VAAVYHGKEVDWSKVFFKINETDSALVSTTAAAEWYIKCRLSLHRPSQETIRLVAQTLYTLYRSLRRTAAALAEL